MELSDEARSFCVQSMHLDVRTITISPLQMTCCCCYLCLYSKSKLQEAMYGERESSQILWLDALGFLEQLFDSSTLAVLLRSFRSIEEVFPAAHGDSGVR